MSLSSVRVSGGAAEPRHVWILHGFMGRGQNWQSFARRLCAARPELDLELIDLRMHGGSQGLPGPHTLAACADDLEAHAGASGLPDVLIGHSFGGRVALTLAGRGLAGQLWVLDAAPASSGERGDTETVRVLAALAELPPRFVDRRAFTAALEARGAAPAIAAWLAKNLVREPDGLRFGLELPALRALLEDHDRTDCWPLVEHPPDSVDLRFVLAGRGSVLAEDDRARLEALASQGVVTVDTLPRAGHWLHVDDPARLSELLLAGLA